MDKQLLDSLNNLSESLEMIAKALDSKSTSNTTTTNALKSGNFSKQLTEISTSLKSIKLDTTQILENQNTILEMQKSKDSTDATNTKKILENQNTILQMQKSKDVETKEISETGKDTKKEDLLKKGVSIVLIIAAAVLAIGLAFKLIGNVDFLSVVSLGLAIVLISYSFQKIADTKITTEQAIVTGKVMVIMAMSMLLTSWVLAFIKPISFNQAATAVLIAGIFALISYNIKDLIIGLGEDLGTLAKSIVFLPLLLPAIALGITLSSWILSFVETISINQALTAILIAGMFTVIAFGIKNIISALGADISTLAKSIVLLPFILPAIALGITLSSWILTMITPISFSQALTGILIAGMFTVMAFGIKDLILALGADINTLAKSIIFLPIILPAIALGISLSSWALKMITPISFGQAITGILIAAMFTVISYGMNRLLTAFKGINPAEAAVSAILMPLLLVAMSMSIAKSSEYLSETKVLTWDKFITAIGISIVFVVLAFALKLMSPALKETSMLDVVKIPLLFTTLSIAIMLSSKILSETTPITYDMLFNIVIFSIALAVSAVVLGLAAWVLAKVGIDKIIEGGLCMIILAGVMAVSSLLVSEGKYENYPGIKWALGVGVSILAFGLVATTFGLIIESGIGAAALALGAVAIVAIAGVIVGTSYILSEGKYGNYPGLGWAMGVGVSLTAFGLSMLGLGSAILLSFGLGALALTTGSAAVLLISQTIVDSAKILSKGNFTGGPTIGWAGGVALALAAFSPIYAMLMANGILKIFGAGGVSPEDFSQAIKTVAGGIVDVAGFFADPRVSKNFTGGPPKEWAEGVGGAIAAFAPVYAALSSGGFFSTKVTPEDMKSSILTIVDGIIVAADRFSRNKSKFDIANVPDKLWGQNVTSAIQAFAPIFSYMSENSNAWIGKSSKDAANDMLYGIVTVISGIISVGKKFAGVNNNIWKSYPTENWVDGISKTIGRFIGLSESVEDVTYASLLKVNGIAFAMSNTARILWRGREYFKNVIDPGYMQSLSKNVIDYMTLAKHLTNINGSSFNTLKGLIGLDPISQAARGMISIAGAYDKLANSLKRFGGALQSIDGDKVNLIRKLTGNLAVLAAMNQDNLENMMKTLEEKASLFSKLVEVNNDKSNIGPSVGDKKYTKTLEPPGASGKSKLNTHQQLDMIIQILSRIDQSTNSLDEYISSATDGRINSTPVSGGGNSNNWF